MDIHGIISTIYLLVLAEFSISKGVYAFECMDNIKSQDMNFDLLCRTARHLHGFWRSVESPGGDNCDSELAEGWYRLFATDGSPARIPTVCIRNDACGTRIPLRIDTNGKGMPEIGETIQAFLCGSFPVLGYWDCCVLKRYTIVHNCGDYNIYWLRGTDRCSVAYCVQALTRFVQGLDNPSPRAVTLAMLTSAFMLLVGLLKPDRLKGDNDKLEHLTVKMGERVDEIYSRDRKRPIRDADIPRLTKSPNKCMDDSLSCSSGDCYKKGFRCDGVPDCKDASDEMNCTSNPVYPCPEGQIRCQDGQCQLKCPKKEPHSTRAPIALTFKLPVKRDSPTRMPMAFNTFTIPVLRKRPSSTMATEAEKPFIFPALKNILPSKWFPYTFKAAKKSPLSWAPTVPGTSIFPVLYSNNRLQTIMPYLIRTFSSINFPERKGFPQVQKHGSGIQPSLSNGINRQGEQSTAIISYNTTYVDTKAIQMTQSSKHNELLSAAPKMPSSEVVTTGFMSSPDNDLPNASSSYLVSNYLATIESVAADSSTDGSTQSAISWEMLKPTESIISSSFIVDSLNTGTVFKESDINVYTVHTNSHFHITKRHETDSVFATIDDSKTSLYIPMPLTRTPGLQPSENMFPSSMDSTTTVRWTNGLKSEILYLKSENDESVEQHLSSEKLPSLTKQIFSPTPPLVTVMETVFGSEFTGSSRTSFTTSYIVTLSSEKETIAPSSVVSAYVSGTVTETMADDEKNAQEWKWSPCTQCVKLVFRFSVRTKRSNFHSSLKEIIAKMLNKYYKRIIRQRIIHRRRRMTIEASDNQTRFTADDIFIRNSTSFDLSTMIHIEVALPGNATDRFVPAEDLLKLFQSNESREYLAEQVFNVTLEDYLIDTIQHTTETYATTSMSEEMEADDRQSVFVQHFGLFLAIIIIAIILIFVLVVALIYIRNKDRFGFWQCPSGGIHSKQIEKTLIKPNRNSGIGHIESPFPDIDILKDEQPMTEKQSPDLKRPSKECDAGDNYIDQDSFDGNGWIVPITKVLEDPQVVNYIVEDTRL